VNRNDVIDVLSAIAAVDRRTVGESDVFMWHQIIGHLDKQLALRAVVDHFREQPGVWLEPGHIVAGVRAIKRDRYERETLEERNVRLDELDERLKSRIVEVAEIRSIAPVKVYTRPSQSDAGGTPVVARKTLSEVVAEVRRANPAARLAAAEGDPLMCGVCGKRELVAKPETGRGVCEPCSDRHDRCRRVRVRRDQERRESPF
jgi:hypothetical protein